MALAMLVFLTGLIPLIGATTGAIVVMSVALLTSVQAGLVVLGALLAIPIEAALQLVLAEVVAPRQDTL